MEGSKGIAGGGGGGEVRKLHIVYFLSHGGKVEQPHLVRVNHVHRNGMHLRDFKSWLSDIRGKGMPDSYSWSYKRKYKSGYVWQDLRDDDLITPFSDNEYVLKGSEISPKEEAKQAPTPRTSRKPLREEADQGISPKTPSTADQGPPGALQPPAHSISDVSEESVGGTAPVIKIDLWKQLRIEQKRLQAEEEGKTTAASSASSGKRYGSGGASASYWWSGRRPWLRNILSCGAVDTNSSALTVQRPKNDMLVRKGSSKSTDDAARSSVPTNPRKSSKKDSGRPIA